MVDQPSSSSRSAGGIILALAIMAGAIIGVAIHQPSAGLVIGIAVGALLALVLWLLNRRKA